MALTDFANLQFDGGHIAANGRADIGAPLGANLAIVDGTQVTFTGAAEGAAAGLAGSLLVSGPGSSLHDTGTNGSLQIGGDGTGHVTIAATAAVTDDGVDTIGGNAGGQGDLMLGAGGTLTDAGLIVGAGGSGQVLVGAATLTSSGPITLGQNVGGTGVITVSGGQLAATGGLMVGGAGAGQLRVENGGTANSGTAIDLAAAVGGAGDVTVTGINSVLTNSGQFIVGDAGVGSLSIQAGGSVITTRGGVADLPALVVANLAPGSGSSVDVAGGGSRLDVTGMLVVGDTGFGQLSLSQGATVTADSLDAAAAAGSDGGISLSGTGAR